MEAELRRYQDLLSNSGRAVILLGIWSIFRLFLILVLDPIYLSDMFIDVIELNTVGKIIFALVVVISLVLDLFLRVFIGRSAIKDSTSTINKGVRPYVIITSIYSIVSVVADIGPFIPEAGKNYNIPLLSSSIVDLLSNIALFVLVYSAIRLNKLRRS